MRRMLLSAATTSARSTSCCPPLIASAQATSTPAPSGSRPTSGLRHTRRARRRGRRRGGHQAAMVGLGTDIGDIADYVGHNDLGTATLLRALAARGFRGRIVPPRAWSSTARGATRAGSTASCGPGPGPGRPRSGPLRTSLPARAASTPGRGGPRDVAPDPRNVYAATKLVPATVRRLCARDGRDGDRAPLPQRLRPRMPRDTPYAGVASIFRCRPAAGEAPARRMEAATNPPPSCRPRQRPRTGGRRARRLQRRERNAAHMARRWPAPRRARIRS